MNTNYSGRLIDIYLGGDTEIRPGEQIPLVPGLGLEQGGFVCTGIAKLVQRVMLCLLTYEHYYDIRWGTVLPQILRAGNFQQAKVLLEELFPEALARAVVLIRSQERNIDPLDERIAELTVDEILVNRGSGALGAVVRVESVAGLTTDLVVPLNKFIGPGSTVQ